MLTVRLLVVLNVFVKALFIMGMLCYSKNAVAEPNLVYFCLRKLLNDTKAEKVETASSDRV